MGSEGVVYRELRVTLHYSGGREFHYVHRQHMTCQELIEKIQGQLSTGELRGRGVLFLADYLVCVTVEPTWGEWVRYQRGQHGWCFWWWRS